MLAPSFRRSRDLFTLARDRCARLLRFHCVVSNVLGNIGLSSPNTLTETMFDCVLTLFLRLLLRIIFFNTNHLHSFQNNCVLNRGSSVKEREAR